MVFKRKKEEFKVVEPTEEMMEDEVPEIEASMEELLKLREENRKLKESRQMREVPKQVEEVKQPSQPSKEVVPFFLTQQDINRMIYEIWLIAKEE